MREIFKNPFFIITLAVAVLLSGMSLFFSVRGQMSFVDNAVGTLLMPFQKAGSAVRDFFVNIGDYFKDYDALKKENESLKLQLRDMSDLATQTQQLQRENQWLYGFLELKRSKTEYEMQNASVIAYDQVSYLSSFTLDKGSTHGIYKGMPVLTDSGLAGCVTQTGIGYSVCTTVISPEFSVYVYTERVMRQGEETVVVTSSDGNSAGGNFQNAGDSCMRINFLPEDTQIQVGDTVRTSGEGGIYPRGLYIGTVTAIEPDPYSQTLYAVVEVELDIGTSGQVMIIKGFKENFESEDTQ